MRYSQMGAFALLMACCATAPAAAEEKSTAAKQEAQTEADPGKFFLFHKGGITPDQARGDLVYCIGLARPILSLRDRMPSQGGLIGGLINGRMAEIDRTRMRNAAMRKCMGLIGYDRYGMPEAEWKALVKDGDIVIGNDGLVDAEVVERMVSYASGPAPKTERLPR